MGHLEEESRKRLKRNQLRKMILQTIKATGYISMALLLPNVLGAMHKMGLVSSPRQGDVIKRSSGKLVRNGLLVWKNSHLILTPKGEKALRRLALNDYALTIPRKWDKRWRVLIFDIPEKRAQLRQQLRIALRSIGFIRLQDSVWVYPYDCEDVIQLLKADFSMGYNVLYMIVDMIEGESRLRKQFKL